MKNAKAASAESQRAVYVPFSSVPLPPLNRTRPQASIRARNERNRFIAAIFGAKATRSTAAHY